MAGCFIPEPLRSTVFRKYINRPLLSVPSYHLMTFSDLQLANLLKALTSSKLRLKNAAYFLDRFRDDLDNKYLYYCSMDVKSLYIACDMPEAVEIVLGSRRILCIRYSATMAKIFTFTKPAGPRLSNYTDSSTCSIKSAQAEQGRQNVHAIDWSASFLTTCDHKLQLNLLEHAAIKNLWPSISAQN